ncbi:PepSY domain-containing protein [Nocardioides sp. DS6]|uniref:PepSY domain-containing protein n=1 Tax=Nocardioides eburneus TaxID=3231482 RepID=A0ABV3SVG9_9ACTN
MAATAVVGCGSDSGDSGSQPTTPAQSAQSPGGTTSPRASGMPTSPAPTSTEPPTSPAPSRSAQTDTALAAIATAERSVPGGKVFDLESDSAGGQRRWDVKVASGQRQYELDITADGAKVVDRRQDKTPDDDVAKLKSAAVPLERAIAIAAGRAQGQGKLSSLEIDSDRRTVLWQISFGGDSGTTVLVDATSGKVLRVGRDVG